MNRNEETLDGKYIQEIDPDVEEHLDRKFENWQKKNKPGDKGYAKKFANWVKAKELIKWLE